MAGSTRLTFGSSPSEEVSALCTQQRKRARISSANTGAITFVQRFGSALNLNMHLHVMVPDGAHLNEESRGDGSFVELPPPTQEELKRLQHRIATRCIRLMGRHLSEEVDFDEEGALGKLQAQSVQRPLPFAEGASSSGRFTAFLRGFSLHAGVRIAAHDKAGRERLCGYGARGPIALKRLR